ncbi:MAG: DUF2889 domain-containing protein [Burkholderiales bacterium]|nr:MAG: DUF2889 domain-containing protein [Burkholderiales bacterium]
MPLEPARVERTLSHTREIRVQAFTRSDGRWELEAHLVDVKPHNLKLASGVRPGGAPIHDLWLRVVFDHAFTILAAEAATDGIPYPGACEIALPDYQRLVGLNLVHGFRKGVAERLGGLQGCTHLTELASALPTAALQAFGADAARERAPGEPRPDSHQPPFFLDRCHALRRDGEAVREYYPKWYRPPRGADAA